MNKDVPIASPGRGSVGSGGADTNEMVAGARGADLEMIARYAGTG